MERKDGMKLVSPSNPILVNRAESIDFPHKGLGKIVSDMMRLMIVQKGCGLAAPQVGLPLRLFTYKHGAMGVVINPVIVHRSLEEIDFHEGCLTYPNRIFNTRRNKSIVVSYRDLAGNIVSMKELDGFPAIVFQHEYDHLEGRLVVSHGVERTKETLVT
jgi:peptide deformylase